MTGGPSLAFIPSVFTVALLVMLLLRETADRGARAEELRTGEEAVEGVDMRRNIRSITGGRTFGSSSSNRKLIDNYSDLSQSDFVQILLKSHLMRSIGDDEIKDPEAAPYPFSSSETTAVEAQTVGKDSVVIRNDSTADEPPCKNLIVHLRPEDSSPSGFTEEAVANLTPLDRLSSYARAACQSIQDPRCTHGYSFYSLIFGYNSVEIYFNADSARWEAAAVFPFFRLLTAISASPDISSPASLAQQFPWIAGQPQTGGILVTKVKCREEEEEEEA